MSARDDFELIGNAVGLAGYGAKSDRYAKAYERLFTPRPLKEWHEDMGECLWYKFPIVERHMLARRLARIGRDTIRILRR